MGGRRSPSKPPSSTKLLDTQSGSPLKPLVKVKKGIDDQGNPRKLKKRGRFKKPESGERPSIRVEEAEFARREIEEVFRRDTASGTYPEHARMDFAAFRQMSLLYQKNTLRAHEKMFRLLKKQRISAPQRWEDIHTNGGLNLSSFEEDQPNNFAVRIAKTLDLGPDSLFMELGPGRGSDARHIAGTTGAQVIGVDISEVAVKRANVISELMGFSKSLIGIEIGDFLKTLKKCEGWPIDMIYSHSTVHYSPDKVLERRIFPTIADVLRKREGKFCLAMKIGSSASARSEHQLRLAQGNRYNPSVDLRHSIFRIYPEAESDVHALLRPSFDIEDSRVVSVEGYDRNGEMEDFCQVIAIPKQRGRSR